MSSTDLCGVCGELPRRVSVNLQAGETLPSAAGELLALADGRVRRCPACGACFRYTYEYEYGAMGDGWETATLARIDESEAKAALEECSPTDSLLEDLNALGVVDGLTPIVQRMNAELDGKDHYDALRKLLDAHVSRGDWKALVALLKHANPLVRKDTVYLLRSVGASLWFHAVRALPDPRRELRENAVSAATSHAAAMAAAPQELRSALVACLRDPAEIVRQHAAWAFAEAWEGGVRPPFDLVEEALVALGELKGPSASPEMRRLAERALAAVAKR